MKILSHLSANDEKLAPFQFRGELSMSAYLIENPEVLSIGEPYLDVEIIDYELKLKGGAKRNNSDGRIDLLITYSQEYIGIVEIKKDQLNENHLKQLEDYLRKKEEVFTKNGKIISEEVSSSPKWIGVLVGASIEPKLATKIADGYKFNASTNNKADEIPIAALTVGRFRSENGNIFIATESYFKDTSSNRDFTKYSFENEIYGKGQLVLAVVKRYVYLHPDVTFLELKRVFPDEYQGTAGVFTTLEEAKEEFQQKQRKRHFINPPEIIQLADSAIAVSNQWGIGNIERFIEIAKKASFKIEIAKK